MKGNTMTEDTPMSMAVARRDKATNAIVVRDPFAPDVWHNAADVGSMIASATERLAMRKGQVEALGELGDAPLSALLELRKGIEDDDRTLLKFDRNFQDALLGISGFKAFVVQTRGPGARIDPLSVRGQLGEMVKELDKAIDAREPPEPRHTYVFQVEVTDDGRKAIVAACKKNADKFRYCAPQGDEAFAEIDRWFKRNQE